MGRMTEHIKRRFREGVDVDVIIEEAAAIEAEMLRERRARIESRRANRRATRLSEDWRPTDKDLSFARERGLDGSELADEIMKFRNYWTAKSQDATKLDWGATWRNWVLRALELRHGRPYRRRGGGSYDSPSRLAPTGANAILAGMGNLARRLDQKRDAARSGDRKVPDGSDAPKQLDFDDRRTRRDREPH
jgi:hypothetical protein